MSEHKAKERERMQAEAAEADAATRHQRREEAHEEKLAKDAPTAEERHEAKKALHHDELAKDEPFVLESSDSDPEFPALDEYEVDEGGAPGSTRKHPGLIWAVIAIVAVIVLCIAFVVAGDWYTPNQAQQAAQRQFDEQVIPEDLGEN